MIYETDQLRKVESMPKMPRNFPIWPQYLLRKIRGQGYHAWSCAPSWKDTACSGVGVGPAVSAAEALSWLEAAINKDDDHGTKTEGRSSDVRCIICGRKAEKVDAPYYPGGIRFQVALCPWHRGADALRERRREESYKSLEARFNVKIDRCKPICYKCMGDICITGIVDQGASFMVLQEQCLNCGRRRKRMTYLPDLSFFLDKS